MQQAEPTPEPQDNDGFMVPEAQLPGKTPTHVPPASVQVVTGTEVLPPVPLAPPFPFVPPDPLAPPRPVLPPDPLLPPRPVLPPAPPLLLAPPVPPAPPGIQQIEPIPEPQDKEDRVTPGQLPGATATHDPPASVQALRGSDVLPPVPLLPASRPSDLPASVFPWRVVLFASQPVRK
jgi:WNK lysine deficient protein kinase